MAKVNLDNFSFENDETNNGEGKDQDKVRNTVSNLSSGLTVRRSEVKSREDVYDEGTKKIFILDISYSMIERIIDEATVDKFVWGKDTMNRIRDLVRKVEAKVDGDVVDSSGDMFGDGPPVTLTEEEEKLYYRLLPVIDDEEKLKAEVVANDLIGYFGVSLDYIRHDSKAKPKIDLMKEMALQEIEKRVSEYPDAEIATLVFNHKPEFLQFDGTVDGLKLALLGIFCCGGTNIKKAIEESIGALRGSASLVHHFVLVSDGQDYQNLDHLLPVLVEKSVVLDFIFIDSISHRWWSQRKGAESLKRLCDATGGRYIRVTTQSDLKKNFVEAARRKCLPPAPMK